MTSPVIRVTRRLPETVERYLRDRLGAVVRQDDCALRRDELARAISASHILLPTITDRIDAALLQPGGPLRLIANFGAGVEHIDLAAAKAAGVIVTNTPDALTDTTAELALTLMLMAARRAGQGERLLRAGQWHGWGPTDQLGQGLSGKLLGLVGYGRIARATAALAKGFGMGVACHSRRPPEAEPGVEWFADLGELAARADVLSLHVPGGAETRHLVNAERRIAAAGLDVYEAEPKVHPGLLALENAVLLPHLGSATLETRTAMGMQAVANIEAFLAGHEPPNRVA